MNPNKIKVGQRVRAVLTETSGPVPLCEGKIIVVDDSGNALVEYDDGWSRWYNKPDEPLIAVKDDGREPQELENLLREIERLREASARDMPGHLWRHKDKGLHLSIINPTGIVGLVKLSSGNTYPLITLTAEDGWSYVGESDERNWQ